MNSSLSVHQNEHCFQNLKIAKPQPLAYPEFSITDPQELRYEADIIYFEQSPNVQTIFFYVFRAWIFLLFLPYLLLKILEIKHQEN